MADREDTRDRILGVALNLFRANGYEATSLREIAERLDLTKAALWYHFPSKSDILRDLVTPFLDEVDTVIEAAEGTTEPRGFLTAYLAVLERHRHIVGFLVGDLGALNSPGIVDRALSFNDRLCDVLAGPGAGPVERVRAHCAIGALQAGVSRFAEEDLGEVTETILDSALGALTASPTVRS